MEILILPLILFCICASFAWKDVMDQKRRDKFIAKEKEERRL